MSLLCSSLCVTVLFLSLLLAVALSLCGSVIPQSDPVHLAKSIATLLQPKPRGSAVALYSLTHQKHRHRIMQWSYRQRFRVADIHILPGVISKWSLTFLLHEHKQRCTCLKCLTILIWGKEDRLRQPYQTGKTCFLFNYSPVYDGHIKQNGAEKYLL